jgi:hypothetical protein
MPLRHHCGTAGNCLFCQETSTRDTANKHSLELCAPIVLVLPEDGCGEWCVSVVFLPGQVFGNWYLYGRWPDKGKCLHLVMGTSWSKDPLGFQHTLEECLAS